MKITNTIHKKILKELGKINTKSGKDERLWVQKYLGSDKPTRCIKGGIIIKLAKKVTKENNFSQKEFTNLIDSLYKNGTTFEEMDIAARLLQVSPKLKARIDPNKLDYWLNFTHGWAETDVLCQSNFTADILQNNWAIWKKLLTKFTRDKNVHKKRASLVLLVKSVRQSEDKKLSDLAFKNIDILKGEKDILITKAVSWILRSLTKNHKTEVARYLNKNKDKLPKIAVREVANKLETGIKSKRKPKLT